MTRLDFFLTNQKVAYLVSLTFPVLGVSPPVHVTVSSTILELYWEEPTVPNGIITSYQLYRYGVLVFQGDTNARLFTDARLAPNSR